MKTLEELDRLERDASNAPWGWRKFGNRNHLVCDYGPRNMLLTNARSRNSAGILEDVHELMPDMALLPAMRNNIRALIDVAREALALQAERKEIEIASSPWQRSPAELKLEDALERLEEGENGRRKGK
jgi:hypothetical protein